MPPYLRFGPSLATLACFSFTCTIVFHSLCHRFDIKYNRLHSDPGLVPNEMNGGVSAVIHRARAETFQGEDAVVFRTSWSTCFAQISRDTFFHFARAVKKGIPVGGNPLQFSLLRINTTKRCNEANSQHSNERALPISTLYFYSLPPSPRSIVHRVLFSSSFSVA